MTEPATASALREAAAGPDRMERVLGWASLAMLAEELAAETETEAGHRL